MTVAELIEELKKMPQEMTVNVAGCYASEGDILEVSLFQGAWRNETTVMLWSDICSG